MMHSIQGCKDDKNHFPRCSCSFSISNHWVGHIESCIREIINEEQLMRVLIADDQADVRYAYHVLLGSRPGLVIVGEAKNAEELLVKALDTYPDVVLLDWELPGFKGVGHLDHLRRALPGLIVIALSGRSEVSHRALKAGANAFVSKVEPPERLLAAISNSNLFIPSSSGRLLASEV